MTSNCWHHVFSREMNSSKFPWQHLGLVCCHGWRCANTRQLHTFNKRPTDQHGGSGLCAFCVAAVTSVWKQPLSLGVGNSALPLPHVVFFRGQTLLTRSFYRTAREAEDARLRLSNGFSSSSHREGKEKGRDYWRRQRMEQRGRPL